MGKRYFLGAGVDQILAQESAGGSVLWTLSDQLGTVKDLVDNSGSVANHVRYDSFGGVVSQSNPAFGSRYGFTGREWDTETGLYYYRSRYYNPGIGRFIGEDSVGFDGGDANLYRYVGNRPVDNVDPLGLSGKLIFPQARLIHYRDRGNQYTNDIQTVINARKQNPNLSIISDLTTATIEHSFVKTGQEPQVDRTKIPDILPQDDRGHIIAAQLGGMGDLNNLFPQYWRENQQGRWHTFENNVVSELDRLNPRFCPVPTNIYYAVSLEYAPSYNFLFFSRRSSLRPIKASAIAQFFGPDGAFGQMRVEADNPSTGLLPRP